MSTLISNVRYRLESIYDPDLLQPYVVKIEYGYDRREEMREWCSQRFGRHTKQWNNPRWAVDNWKNIFYFKNARDRTMFVLRWSS